MGAKKKTSRTSAKKATRKRTAARKTSKKVAGKKVARPKKGTTRKTSPQSGEVVYSDLRKIALARALGRR